MLIKWAFSPPMGEILRGARRSVFSTFGGKAWGSSGVPAWFHIRAPTFTLLALRLYCRSTLFPGSAPSESCGLIRFARARSLLRS